MPELTCEAIAAWIEHCGTRPGSLFKSWDRAHKRNRLTGRSVARIVKMDAGESVGVENVWPHGLRNAAITHMLDRTNGNVRVARKLSRHAKLDTLALYDDTRAEVAALIQAMSEPGDPLRGLGKPARSVIVRRRSARSRRSSSFSSFGVIMRYRRCTNWRYRRARP